jgi:RAT1-interacting protein
MSLRSRKQISGTLTRVAASPYLTQNSDPWTIACCKFNGVIFLCEQVTDDKRKKQANENEYQKKLTYWGHKFEQYLTKDTIDASFFILYN